MKRYAICFAFSVFCLCFVLNIPGVSAEQTTLSWYPPTTNDDGTPIIDLAGYKIHLGTVSRIYTRQIDVGNATTYTVTNLTEGSTHYFAITAYNSKQKESKYSNEISRTISADKQYILSVNKGGTGTGTITSTPAGISCGSDCIEGYPWGTTVTLSALSDGDSAFTGWSGACTGLGDCTLIMDDAKAVTGTFTKSVNQTPNNGSNDPPLVPSYLHLPRTGQTETHGPGDDGDTRTGIEWPDPRFIDNGDGTVTDNLTGLMWLKDGSCFGKKPWKDALNAIRDFNVTPSLYRCADYSQTYGDWRMPNIKEIDSLINFGVPNSSLWLNESGFFGIQTSLYWTSTTYPGNESALILDMGQGIQKISPMKKLKFILPVRGETSVMYYEVPQSGQTESHMSGDDGDKRTGKEWPEPRFMNNGDGTVTDMLTGLMWLKDGYCLGKRKWEDALNAVIDFNANPSIYNCTEYSQIYDDWHMPNVRELESLIHYGIAESSEWLSMVGFVDIKSASYWSSTSNIAHKDRSFIHDLRKRVRTSKSQNSKLFFLPVRNLQ